MAQRRTALFTGRDAVGALELAAKIKPLLAGHPPGIQGGVLVELLAIFLAGHRPEVRPATAAMFLKCVMDMVPVVERELFPDGYPTQH